MFIPTLLLALCLQASPKDYLSDVVAEMRKEWPQNRMVEVVCHGHSVPAGYAKTPEVRALDAYPNLLREGLCRRFPNAVIKRYGYSYRGRKLGSGGEAVCAGCAFPSSGCGDDRLRAQ